MNVRIDDEKLATMKFAVGQPVTRAEDPRLLRGEGRYTDDVNRPGQVWCAMVRSPVAHGILRAIDADAARAMPASSPSILRPIWRRRVAGRCLTA